MTSRIRNRLIFVVVLALLAVGILVPTFFKEQTPEWWPSSPIRLGLDLKGGTYLVLGVETSEAVKSRMAAIGGEIKSELRKQKRRVLRTKVMPGPRLKISFLSNKHVDAAKKYIQEEISELSPAGEDKSGSRIELLYQMPPQAIREIEQDAVKQAIETIRNRVDQYGVSEPTIQRSGEKHIIVQLPDITNIDEVKRIIGSVAKLEFRLTSNSGDFETIKTRDGGQINVEEDVLMTGDAIKTANVEINPNTNEVEVSLSLNSTGAKIFGRITSENTGRQLAIVLDGISQSAPRINEPILAGRASISGNFTAEEAHRLAIVLRSGALPAPLTFEEERTVGSSLGADSIRKGALSMLIGSLLVIVFMMFYYKKSGILAVTCLVLNLAFLLALLALLGATLTLPGIAGLILTVGMAVDANVIIFQRIREELKNGASHRAAIEAGFLKANSTIVDANVTTFLTAIILYGLGTGPIKGFAVTLSLGIITSVFTALYVARVGFDAGDFRNSEGKLSI